MLRYFLAILPLRSMLSTRFLMHIRSITVCSLLAFIMLVICHAMHMPLCLLYLDSGEPVVASNCSCFTQTPWTFPCSANCSAFSSCTFWFTLKIAFHYNSIQCIVPLSTSSRLLTTEWCLSVHVITAGRETISGLPQVVIFSSTVHYASLL